MASRVRRQRFNNDEFNGTSLNRNNWGPIPYGLGDAYQSDDPQHVQEYGGSVHLLATKNSATDPCRIQDGLGHTGGTLMGWQLDAANTGLAPFGLNCDTLPKYTGGYSVSAGTTISGKRIETDVDLSAGNIVVEKSCIKPMPGSGFAAGDSMSTAAGPDCGGNFAACPPQQSTVTIRDSEFDASNWDAQTIAKSCAFGGLANLYRNYMHDMGSGICMNKSGNYVSAVVEGNYVTRLRAYGSAGADGSHNESATVRAAGHRWLPNAPGNER